MIPTINQRVNCNKQLLEEKKNACSRHEWLRALRRCMNMDSQLRRRNMQVYTRKSQITGRPKVYHQGPIDRSIVRLGRTKRVSSVELIADAVAPNDDLEQTKEPTSDCV